MLFIYLLGPTAYMIQTMIGHFSNLATPGERLKIVTWDVYNFLCILYERCEYKFGRFIASPAMTA